MKISRRTFLNQTSLMSASALIPPVDQLASIILNQALAADPASEMKYIAFACFGAPPRWGFDQWLRLKAGEAVIGNPQVGTRLAGSNVYSSTEYATFAYQGVEVPVLWQSQVAARGGGTRAMSDLLQHMIVFRGYGTGVDGHGSNSVRQFAPLPSVGSVSAHMADQSKALFRAIQFPNFASSVTGYYSQKGTSVTAVNEGPQNLNLASQLLTAFAKRPAVATLEAAHSRYKHLVDQATSLFKVAVSSRYPSSQSLKVDQDAAISRLKAGIADLDQAWPVLYQKYEQIIIRTMKDRTTAGLSDRPVLTQAATQVESPYVVEVDGVVHYPQPNLDMRDWLNTVDCRQMIQAFALTEFAVTRGLATSIESVIGSGGEGLRGVFVGKDGENFTQPTAKVFGLVFDQHRYGSIASVFLTNCFNRAFAAALNELVDQLKSANLFSSTVIHLTGDFGRTPRETQGGSDHGFDSMASSVLTGLHSGSPLVVGNISATGMPGTVYSGTFGMKSLTNVGGVMTTLTPASVTSTLAELLALPHNPWANSAVPLIVRSSGKLVVKASAEIK